MKQKNITWIMGMLFLIIIGVASCSDEFNEDEFIQKQADLAESKAQADHQRALDIIQAQLTATLAAIEAESEADQELAALQALLAQELELLKASLTRAQDSLAAANFLAAYRAAGLFTEFTVVANDESGQPLADVTISVSSIADPVVTGADGNAVFQDVIVGNNLLTLASDAILDFQATVNFARLNIRTIGTTNVVEPQTANLSLNLFADVASAEDLGTVAGTVTIETDLTNDTPEFPAGGVVTADLTDFLFGEVIANEEGLNGISNLSFTEGDLGVGTIDATNGAYELKVPVPSNGANVRLNFPEIEANQTLAIAQRDGAEIPAEIAEVPARFNLNTLAENVESVAGFEVVVNEPATIGTGFAFDFEPMPFNLTDRFYSGTEFSTESVIFSNDFRSAARVNFSIPAIGSGYTSSPTVSAGSDSLGYGFLKLWATELNVVEEGTGYGNEQPVDVRVVGYARGGGIAFDRFIKTITSDADGTLPATIPLDSTDPFGSENISRTNAAIDSVRIVLTGNGNDAEVTANTTGTMYGFRIDNSAAIEDQLTVHPNLTVSGGGATTQATIEVSTFNRYKMAISNAGTGYTLEPDLSLEGTTNDGDNSIFSSSSNIDFIRRTNPNSVFSGISLASKIEIDGNGGLRNQFPDFRIITADGLYYDGEPELKQELNTQQMEVNVFVNDADEGSLSGVINNAGSRYDENRTVTVTPRFAGAGGSGFEWIFNDRFNETSGLYIFNFQEITNEGTGYRANMNMASSDPNGSSNVNVFVRRGESSVIDRRYGTGVRLENVGGDN